jgi:uncharacterized lipoprotein
MLNRMCSAPPCSHAAESTVHQRPTPKTGSAPLAPNVKSAAEVGEPNDIRPPMPIEPLEKIRVRM